MPNTIKYSTTGDTRSLKKGNFFIGVGDDGKGTSLQTRTYNGVTPSSSGYTVYIYNPSQESNISFHSANSDAELISFTNGLANQSFTGVTQCLSWYAGQSNYVCVNKDYEGISTNGLSLLLDCGFTPSYPRSGTTLYDLSYSGYNGTLTNGPSFSGSNGGMLVFDGADDYITLGSGSNTLIQNKTNITLGILFQLDTNAVLRGLVGTLAYGCGGNLGIVSSNGGLTFYNDYGPWPATGGTCYPVGFSNYVTPNNWIYAVATYDGSTTRMYGIKNGTLSLASGTSKTGSTNTFSRNFEIMRGGIYYSQGKVITSFVYNRTLSQSEILSNYQTLIPRLVNENIVTNGLTFYVDAGYTGSYPKTGTTWFDISGVGNNGTLANGPTFSSADGGSIVFDGVNDYVVTPSFSLSSATSCLTFNFWVKSISQTASVQSILGKDTNVGNVPHILIGRSANSDTLRWNYNNGTGAGLIGFSNFFTGYDNAWVNIQIVADYNLDTVTLYRNGTQFGQQSQPSAVFPNTNTTMYLSSFAINAFLVFYGNISISQIYNRALSYSEILQNYNAQKSRFGL